MHIRPYAPLERTDATAPLPRIPHQGLPLGPGLGPDLEQEVPRRLPRHGSERDGTASDGKDGDVPPRPGPGHRRPDRRRKASRRVGTWPLVAGGAAALAAAVFLVTQFATDGDGGARAGGPAEKVRSDDLTPSDEANDTPSGGATNSGAARDSSHEASAEPSTAPAQTPGGGSSARGPAQESPQRQPSTGATGATPGGERLSAMSTPGKAHDDPGGRSTGPTSGTAGASGPVLRPGDSGPEVAELQRRLKQTGILARSSPTDGHFTPAVHEAVFRFQVAEGVRGDVDGEYGTYTRRALESRTRG
ncbi:peptidoglycan-binding protein [Streptomyces sp. NPDC059009]|uniref:peptidoglycan-binding protein n=1 Tax=Streptomyces sp. NPDC059009 TaxID=3346694 RepID=UPI003682F5F7